MSESMKTVRYGERVVRECYLSGALQTETRQKKEKSRHGKNS